MVIHSYGEYGGEYYGESTVTVNMITYQPWCKLYRRFLLEQEKSNGHRGGRRTVGEKVQEV